VTWRQIWSRRSRACIARGWWPKKSYLQTLGGKKAV